MCEVLKGVAVIEENDDPFAPMELIYTHELEALKRELGMVTQQRDALRAQFRQWQQPFTYSSGSTTVPDWLKNLQVLSASDEADDWDTFAGAIDDERRASGMRLLFHSE